MRARRVAAAALVIQMEKPPLLALDATDRAIGKLLVGVSVERHPDRKAARRFSPDDVNGADALATRPLPDGVEALLAQRPVVQPDCLRFRHFTAVKVDQLSFHAKPAIASNSIFDQTKTARLAGRLFRFTNSMPLFAAAEAPRPPSGAAGLIVGRRLVSGFGRGWDRRWLALALAVWCRRSGLGVG